MIKIYSDDARKYNAAKDLHDESFQSTDSSNNGGQNDHWNTPSDDDLHIRCYDFNTSVVIHCIDASNSHKVSEQTESKYLYNTGIHS